MAIAQFKMELAWKTYKVSLDLVHSFMKENAGPDFCGLQAHEKLEVWFLNDPGAVIIDLVTGYWDNLTEASDETKKYLPNSILVEAIAAAKSDAVTKDYNSLNVAQKKIIMGIQVTRADLGL